MVFQPFEGETFDYKGTPQGSKWPAVSAINLGRMLNKGCVGYFVSIVDTMMKILTKLSNMHVVCKFSRCVS